MSSFKILVLSVFVLVACGADRDLSLNEIEQDLPKYDSKIVERIKNEVKREILLPLIGGLKTALDCDCSLGESCPCLSGFKTDYCLTEDCVKTAASFLSMMNTSADPCEDLYEFSCGKWIAENSENRKVRLTSVVEGHNKEVHKFIMEEMQHKDQPESVRKFLKGYQVCLNYDKLLPSHEATIMDLLKDIKVPLLKKDWKEEDHDWIESFITAFHRLETALGFDIGVETNPFNNTENIFVINLPPLLKSVPKSEWTEVKQFWQRFSENNNETIVKDISDAQDMEQFILNITNTFKYIEEHVEEYRLTTIGELNKLFPSIDWLTLFQNLFSKFLKPIDYSINNERKVLVRGISAITKLLKAIDTGIITKRVVTNYIGSVVLNTLIAVHPLLNKVTSEVQQKKCFEHFMSSIPFTIDYIYGKHRKQKTMEESMMKYSYKGMHELVSKSDWLDSETKQAVHEKLSSMKYFLSFSAFSQDAKMLDKLYEGLPEMTNNTFENIIAVATFTKKILYQMIKRTNSREEWYPIPSSSATRFQAFNFPTFNSIYVLAGIQIYPFFLPNRPNYVNFGGMGLILGHEITHSLDETGSKRDKYGNIRNWWTDKAEKQFHERAQCFVEQYNSYEYGGETNKHMNGSSTLSENIADNAGIRQSFYAYKLWEKDHGKESALPGLEKYTPYQLLFISFANAWCSSLNPEETYEAHKNDEHSPHRFRILGSVSNMKEFAEAFNCKTGSKMNPQKKCVVW